MEDRSTLKPTEYHPSADVAMEYIKTIPLAQLNIFKEAFASCAIEGNRLSEVCLGTLNRLLNGEPVSDRYIMGLAFAMMPMKEWNDETT